jgi:hypothetical protein
VGLLLVVCATGVVLVAAVAMTALLRPATVLDAAITTGVVATATITLLLEVTGLAGQLRRGPTFALGLVVLLVSATLARTRWVGVRSAVATAVGRLPRDGWALVVWFAAAGALAWQAVVAIVLRPYAYDGLTYHLTTAATWVQQGDLGETTLSNCCASYPLTADLMFAWPMLFQGSDALVNTVQLGFVVLGALAVMGIARAAGLANPGAVAAGALFVLTPVVLAQAATPYVDVMVAAWALAGMHSVIRYAVSRDRRSVVTGVLAAGMLFGTKGTGLLWALAIVGVLLVLAVLRNRREAAAVALAAAVAVGALGSFWYVRNWVERGNPMHPFQVEVAGQVLFEGPRQVGALTAHEAPTDDPWPIAAIRSWSQDLDVWNARTYDYQQRNGGLGPLWAWLGAPLLAVLAVVLARRRSPVLYAVAIAAAVFLVQPYRWWSRFTIPLAALGAIGVVVAAYGAPRRWMQVAVKVVAIPLVLAGAVFTIAKVDPAGRAEPLPARELLALVGEPAGERTAGAVFFPEYRFVEEIPAGATVVVDLAADDVRFVYPLFGPHLDNRVVRLRAGTPLAGAWVVTATDRPVDRAVADGGDHVLVSERRGLRAWRPR